MRGRELADGGDAAQQFVERVELRAQLGMQFGVQAGAQQFAGGQVVALAQAAADFQRLRRDRLVRQQRPWPAAGR